MQVNNIIRKIRFIIGLSLTGSLLYACHQPPENKEFKRFEEMVSTAGLNRPDSMVYIYWTKHSCKGCRSLSLKQLRINDYIIPVKILCPSDYAGEIKGLDSSLFFIDDTNIFGKKYFGVDNVGLIKLGAGHVFLIKNYNPDEMEEFIQALKE